MTLHLAFEQIDDVVDAIPVHLGCGMWGVFAASLFATKDNCEYPPTYPPTARQRDDLLP